MARYNGYPVGTGLSTIGYTVNGDAVDWTYGDQNIISYVPEVGSTSQGFWPPESDVVDLCLDQVHSNKIFALVAGADIVIKTHDLSQDEIIPGDNLELSILIQNRGLSASETDIDINVNALNELLSLDTESYTMNEMDARDSDDFSILIEIADNAPICLLYTS